MYQSVPMTLDLDICKEDIHILLAEDENETRQLLKRCLQREGYNVVAVRNGQEALQAFAASPFDMVILDIRMPVLDGWVVCAELRKRTDVPIMLVTANSRPDDVVRGISLGADCYVSKPFTLKELRARIQAVLRRSQRNESCKAGDLHSCGEITLDKSTHEVSVRNKRIILAPTEYRLLQYFIHNPNKHISIEELLTEVWGYQVQFSEELNIVRVAIRRLRSKIEEDASSPTYLKTIRGLGYQFCIDNQTVASL